MDDSELSFNDVTALVYEILHTIDDSEFLYFRLDAQIEHMLLDEFQDTSILQYEILRPLIEEITSGSGIFDEGSFFFVGDVKQSIYRFRGGVSALFGAVVEQHGTEVQQLLTNYRSQKELIEFVNTTFESKIKNYTAQNVREEASGGYVAVIQNDELLEETLTQVKMLIQRGMDMNEIAILCATNGDGELVKQRLQEEQIEVVTETTTKLINQRSVKALLEYLKYLYFEQDIYRYNFFALINMDVQKIDKVDINVVPVMQIIKNTIEKYGLFSDDFHLIRFLNVLRGYSDIEALLFEYERLDAAAAASDLSGVRVLTIHKSKGLEYESVIVMDRVKKAPAPRDAIIYKYDKISLLDVYLRIKGRDALDEEYAEALSHEKSLAQEDLLNALYVAFTRARDNLFIVSKSKDSMFSLLDLEFKVQGELKESSIQTEAKPQEPAKKLEFKEFYYGTQSDILALEESKEEDLSAINFGLALHYMLEMLSSFSLNVVDDAYEMMLNKYGVSLEYAELLEIKNRVKAVISHSEFQTLVQGKLYKEKAIRYRKNLRYIDLLVKHEDGVWNVIDYKSSMNYSEHHQKQVSYYVRAVQAITGERVEGYICYLLADKTKLVKI
jgi:exodeoxyribonuclease V beta subunit